MNPFILAALLASTVAPIAAQCLGARIVPPGAGLPMGQAQYKVAPKFETLRFGAIRPQGWVMAQMKRDLETGFAGHLDELCKEASSDVYCSNRGKNTAPKVHGAEAWWNGETEGNWRCGLLMLAALTGEPHAAAKARSYVDRILASQEADGYIGIFAPDQRYKGLGELLTQTCLFRGLIAYGEATGDMRLITAVKRAVGRTIEGYSGCKTIQFRQHDCMFTDILEYFHAGTGDPRYLDFGLRLHWECPKLRAFHENPMKGKDFQKVYSGGHGATVTESMRMPFWFWAATGDPAYLKMGQELVAAMNGFCLPSGALVSDEAVSALPNPWSAGYEYCTLTEHACTLLNSGNKLGGTADFEAAEHLWFNAAQGSREPDGASVLYCSTENRLSIHDEIGKRQRFSPTHQQVAVCCNPNAARIASYHIANAWVTPTGQEPALAAVVYIPCEVKTRISGTPVTVTEKTCYPYGSDVTVEIAPDSPVSFSLWLRNPQWSLNTHVSSPGATVTRHGDFWQLHKQWKAGDKASIQFDQKIREVRTVNDEVALQYGPLLYVLPIKGDMEIVKTYDNSSFKDYHVNPSAEVKIEDLKGLSFAAEENGSGYGFTPQAVAGTNLDYPLDNPPTVLKGDFVAKDGAPILATLVPIGAKSALLRLVTFPVKNRRQHPNHEN